MTFVAYGWSFSTGTSCYTHWLTPNSSAGDAIPALHQCATPDMPCAARTEPQRVGADYAAARSQHPGGVNAVFVDGHVDFYCDNIDSCVWRALSTIAATGALGATAIAMMRHYITMSAMLGFCLLSCWGCSRATGRQALEGTVTLDGNPLAEGSIVFIPQAGTKSPTCGGNISQGRFSILPAGGASCGTFRVEITAARNTGRKVMNHQVGKLVERDRAVHSVRVQPPE